MISASGNAGRRPRQQQRNRRASLVAGQDCQCSSHASIVRRVSQQLFSASSRFLDFLDNLNIIWVFCNSVFLFGIHYHVTHKAPKTSCNCISFTSVMKVFTFLMVCSAHIYAYLLNCVYLGFENKPPVSTVLVLETTTTGMSH